jgi:glyoxylate reductase
MLRIYVTRSIPGNAMEKLSAAGIEVDVNPHDRALTKEELKAALSAQPYDGILTLLTDQIDAEVFEAAPTVKIVANYAVGFNNIDIAEAKKRGIIVTNTPGDLTDSVAEHTFAMMLILTHRVLEGDAYMRQGKYKGWDPNLLLGREIKGQTLALIGAGRIGSRVAYHAVKGFDMRVIYYDVQRNESIEKEYGATYFDSVDAILPEADVVSLHVPLMDATRHLMNKDRLKLMKPGAFLINTSRGPVVDEAALVDALKNKTIRGAGLDVYENEPALAPGLSELSNVILTPHIASATEYAREEMSRLATDNLIAFFHRQTPPNVVNA